MTENKPFIKEQRNGVFEIGKHNEDTDRLTINEIVDMLNEQQETITTLTKEIKILRNILYLNVPKEFSRIVLKQSKERINKKLKQE